MNLRQSLGLTFVALAFSLFITPLELSGQCMTNVNKDLQEKGVEPLSYKVATTKFQDIIDAFLDNPIGKNSATEMGGFVFIPIRIIDTASLDPQADTLPDPIPFISRGLRIYLTYYETESNGDRVIKVFDFDSNAMMPCTDIPAPRVNVITLPTESANVGRAFPPDFPGKDEEIFSANPPMDLSYLSYDDYLYLVNFPPDGGQFGPTNRATTHIEIKRALSGQTFDLRKPNSDTLNQYRTLSFRPYPYPSVDSQTGQNQEAIMAFRYGHYCPPYWYDHPPQGGQQQERSIQQYSRKPAGPSQKAAESQNGHIIKAATQAEVEKILNAFMNDQAISRENIVSSFVIQEEESFWDKYGLLLLLAALVLGVLIGLFIRNIINGNQSPPGFTETGEGAKPKAKS